MGLCELSEQMTAVGVECVTVTVLAPVYGTTWYHCTIRSLKPSVPATAAAPPPPPPSPCPDWRSRAPRCRLSRLAPRALAVDLHLRAGLGRLGRLGRSSARDACPARGCGTGRAGAAHGRHVGVVLRRRRHGLRLLHGGLPALVVLGAALGRAAHEGEEVLTARPVERRGSGSSPSRPAAHNGVGATWSMSASVSASASAEAPGRSMYSAPQTRRPRHARGRCVTRKQALSGCSRARGARGAGGEPQAT